MTETRTIVETLKTTLRAHKITYADVAVHLGLSEGSVKRMFSKHSFTLERLERICELAGVKVADIARKADSRGTPLTQLTPEQEETLLGDPKLISAAYLVLNGMTFEQIRELYSYTETELVARLARLDRLGMIELLPGNRVRRLVARNFDWRPNGPVRRYFNDQMSDYIDSRFNASFESLRFVGARLSDESAHRIQKSIDRLVQDIDDHEINDADLPAQHKRGFATLLAVRPWEPPLLRSLRREEQ